MVIVHPEYAMLILEINDLRDQIANLIVERDMLDFYICTDIEMDYMLKIGAIEYKLIIAGNKYRKNLRKLEIIEDKIAKKMPINMSYINRKVNTEFRHKTEIENKMSKDIDLAIEMSELEAMDQDLLDEINIVYSKLQKIIFDLNPSEEKQKEYEKIEKYYRKGNYKKLTKLAENYDENDVFQDEMANMQILKAKYLEVLKVLKKQIRKIKNSFPYNQRVILEDENLCRRKKDSLNRDIIETNLENKKIEKKIENKLNKLT